MLDGRDEVIAAVGQHLGHSSWLSIGEDRVRLFAEATGDHRGADAPGEHVRSGSRGRPMIQDHLLLSLSNLFLPEILEVRGFTAGINTGTDEVRFVSAAPVGSTVRAAAEMLDATELPDGNGVDTVVGIVIEVEGAAEPVCSVRSRSRWLS